MQAGRSRVQRRRFTSGGCCLRPLRSRPDLTFPQGWGLRTPDLFVMCRYCRFSGQVGRITGIGKTPVPFADGAFEPEIQAGKGPECQ